MCFACTVQVRTCTVFHEFQNVHVYSKCMSLRVSVYSSSTLHIGQFCSDWNTFSDEASVPQLRQVSCAALACLLKHTGLLTYALNCTYVQRLGLGLELALVLR